MSFTSHLLQQQFTHSHTRTHTHCGEEGRPVNVADVVVGKASEQVDEVLRDQHQKNNQKDRELELHAGPPRERTGAERTHTGAKNENEAQWNTVILKNELSINGVKNWNHLNLHSEAADGSTVQDPARLFFHPELSDEEKQDF